MNLLKRELKANRKPFFFWCLGLLVLIFSGMAKFTGLREGGEAVAQMMAAFPRAVQAMLGMVDVDVTALPGYYAVLMYYALICISIYALSLGANAVGRESADKTYEFLFTKPMRRGKVLGIKLLAGFFCLLGFTFFSGLFSALSLRAFRLEGELSSEIELFTLTLLLVGLLFYLLSAMLTALSRQPEKGARRGTLLFVAFFVIGMVYDMLENAALLRFFTPLRFFPFGELLQGELNPGFAALSLLLSAAFGAAAFYAFTKKDLQ